MENENTFENGSVRHIIFKEGDIWYGVALEFNIVEEGDDPVAVMASLFEAIQGYIETAQKHRISAPLNQKPDKTYQDLWEKIAGRDISKYEGVPLPPVYNFGYTPFSSYALCH